MPFGIYNVNDQLILFSKNLGVLEILNENHKFLGLINYYGESSINNSGILISNFELNVKNQIKSATFIERRRWNLIMKNEILLKLPEENIREAINNYSKIYANLSNKDLKKIVSIDLRISNKAIIKYKEFN